MSESRSSLVDCPVCGEEFDPTDAGGWCTNSECGEWQYIGDEVPEPAADAGEVGAAPDGPDLRKGADPADDSDEGGSDGSDDSASGVPAGADDADGTAAAANGSGDESDGVADGDDAATGAADGVGDGTSATDADTPEPAIRKVGDQPDADGGGDDSTADDETAAAGGDETIDESDAAESPAATGDDEAAGPASGGDDAITCPDCGTAIDPDDNFCAGCGADLEDVPEPSTLESCPSCDTEVSADDSFCASCGEDLDAAREALGGGSPTGDSADPDTTDADGAADAEGAPDADAETRATDEGATEAPETLVLRVRGEEIAVADDETVGREVRRVLTQSGAEEDQAVRIHREHLRFVREDGQFYVVDLGDNPTRLNGTRLSKGDRETVDPGDEIELSGVATLSVESP